MTFEYQIVAWERAMLAATLPSATIINAGAVFHKG
jgi:hypothetical protein